MGPQIRLDASESVWFNRELEAVDTKVYRVKYPDLEARSFLPKIGGVSEWATTYRYSELEAFGKAKFIADWADDLPRSDVSANDDKIRYIRALADSWGYNIMELKAMAAGKVSLNPEKAMASRRAAEELIDETIALGSTPHALEGLLSFTTAGSYTLATKAAGGVSWGTLDAPNATAEEVYRDLVGIAVDMTEGTDNVIDQVDIILPIAAYEYAAHITFGSGLESTPLKKALESPRIRSIRSWHRCKTAGAGSTTRMVAYKNTPEMLGYLVPMEFQSFAPQQKNFAYIVPNLASCGGAVLRYPKACKYADGL